MTYEKNSKPLTELCSTFNGIPSVFLYNSRKYAIVTLECRGFRVYSTAGYIYWCLSLVSNRRVSLQARNEKRKIAQYLFWDSSLNLYIRTFRLITQTHSQQRSLANLTHFGIPRLCIPPTQN